MEIRKIRKSDEREVIQLWESVFPDDPPHNEPSSVLDAKLRVDDLVFVAEEDQKIRGACMAGYDGHRGWLYAVAVSPDCRRMGIGKKLVQTAVKSLREIGCIKINLQIRSTNTEVATFYKSLGFSVEDRLSMGILME